MPVFLKRNLRPNKRSARSDPNRYWRLREAHNALAHLGYDPWYRMQNADQFHDTYPHLRGTASNTSHYTPINDETTRLSQISEIPNEMSNAPQAMDLSFGTTTNGGSILSTKVTHKGANREDTVYIGKQIVERWKDPRPLIWKILAPAVQMMWQQLADAFATPGVNQFKLTTPATQLIKEINHLEGTLLTTLQTIPLNQQSGNAGGSAALSNEGLLGNNGGLGNYLQQDLQYADNYWNLALFQTEVMIRNACTHRCTIHLYEYVAIHSNSFDIQTAWDNAITEEQVAGAALTSYGMMNPQLLSSYDGGAAIANTNNYILQKVNLGERPHGRQLKKYWRKLNYTKIELHPGKAVVYTITTQDHRIYPADLYYETVTLAHAFIKNTTKKLLIIVEPPWTDNLNNPYYTGKADVELAVKFRQNVVAYQPYRCQTKRIKQYPVYANGQQAYETGIAANAQGYTDEVTETSVNYSTNA